MSDDRAAPPARRLRPSEALTRSAPSVAAITAGRAPVQVQRTRFGFRVGQVRLLIGVDTISEVVAQPAIFPVPNMPAWLLGLMNQRGNLLPVFDLHSLFDSDDEGGQKRMVLILDRGEDAVGIPIDGLPQSVTGAGRVSNLPPLPDVLISHVSAAYSQEGAIWLDFDHKPFFSALGARLSA